ncbi:MAG: aspartate--tRNA(Asn) ligase [Candidatus Magasanikbacteria bacterium]|nr:aspartate--tRNA(Asn) ligase [Candidatus Magasanikbacteria bacterium]
MNRTLSIETVTKIGEEVLLKGWINARRNMGKIVFLDLRDRGGIVQLVGVSSQMDAESVERMKDVRHEWVVEVTGVVQERGEKQKNSNVPTGNVEVLIKELRVLSMAEPLPIDLEDDKVGLDIHLDHLPITLRAERWQDVFKVQETIIQSFREALAQEQFTEFQSPALVGGDAEGGSAVFKVDYFYNQKAYLATSPQLYKQIMTGVFERVFTTAKIFRAEKSATTRHLSEIVQMDFEMGFINDQYDVMAMLEKVIKHIVARVVEKHASVFAKRGVPLPLSGEKFPIFKLHEAQDILGAPHSDDLDPEQERAICEWAKKEKNSDFVFITHFPTKARAWYTYEEPSEAPLSRGFDLLFRGLEINSGAQRVHSYETLVEKIKSRGLDPEKFSFYLEAFKYGMPPHGGCSTGLERITARMLEIPNVKEAVLFPRDLNRIDLQLSPPENKQ